MAAKKSASKRTAAKRKPAKKRTVARRTTTKRKATTRKTAAKRKPAKKSTRKTIRKTTAKRSTARKTTSKVVSSAAPKKMAMPTMRKAFSKTQILNYLAESTDLKKKEISLVLEALALCINGHIKKKGPGVFNLPGLLKIVVVHKPAKKARKGINPFTGEPTIFKAKPARNVVKLRALKKLKEMAT